MQNSDLMRLLRRVEIQSRRESFREPPDDTGISPAGAPPMDAPPPGMPPEGLPPHGKDNRPFRIGRGQIITMLSKRDGVTQKELSEMMCIRPQSLSEALTKLEDEGMIRRERSETDKREVNVFITNAGRACCEDIHRRHEAHAAEFFSALTEEEKKTLGELLTKLVKSHDGCSDR
ncbi:MAG: MarR family transcriptional regulator [Clostridiales bacterium]|nr:MarR family transcriptional regulator [Clostridiales bacterium]